MIWKILIFLSLTAGIVTVGVLLSDDYEGTVLNEIIEGNLIDSGLSQVQVNSNYTANDGLVYTTSGNGIITITEDWRTLGKQGFVISGTYLGNNITRTTREFTWAWNSGNYTEITQTLDEDNETIINISENVDYFQAYNNNPNFNWTMEWRFFETKPTKIIHTLTNNLGNDITNTKFWYVHQLDPNKTIWYNGGEYDVRTTRSISGNLNDRLPRVNINGEYEFRFNDLIEDNFTITNIYVGNGSVIDFPQGYILGVGVTKGNGVFGNGVTIVLDPLDTGFISPLTTGTPLNQWTNGVNLKTSNNADATETTVGHQVDTSNYTFNLPSDAMIEGIEIELEGSTGTCGL